MSDLCITIIGAMFSIFISGCLRYLSEDCVERQAAEMKITGFELLEWIKRRTG